MSINIYAIEGLGVKINYDNIDLIKYIEVRNKVTELQIENYGEIKQKIEQDIFKNFQSMSSSLGFSIIDDLEFILRDNKDIPEYIKLGIGTATDKDFLDYILYYRNYPWTLSEEEKNIKREEVEEAIAIVLSSIYKDNIKKDDIKKEIDNISTYY